MSVRISDGSHVCLYCSTSGIAFGPVFDGEDEAAEFLEWLDGMDPRKMGEDELLLQYRRFMDPEPSDVQIYGAGSR